MCGLVGFFGDNNLTDIKVFQQLLQADYFRGPHSVGVAMIGNGFTGIRKSLDHPAHFLDQKSVQNALNNKDLRGAIGHNRYATLGGVTLRS